MVNQELVRQALKKVYDPELRYTIVDLGLVYDVAVQDRVVHIVFTLTSMGCPIGPLIAEQIREAVLALPGVKDVQAELTFSPPWDVSLMSEDVRAALGFG